MTLFSYLICYGFWGYTFQLRTEFKRGLGGSWRMVGLDSASWRIKVPDVSGGLKWADATFTEEMGTLDFTLQRLSSSKGWKEATLLINSWGLLSRNKRNQWQTELSGNVEGKHYYFSPAVKPTVFTDGYGLCENFFCDHTKKHWNGIAIYNRKQLLRHLSVATKCGRKMPFENSNLTGKWVRLKSSCFGNLCLIVCSRPIN